MWPAYWRSRQSGVTNLVFSGHVNVPARRNKRPVPWMHMGRIAIGLCFLASGFVTLSNPYNVHSRINAMVEQEEAASAPFLAAGFVSKNYTTLMEAARPNKTNATKPHEPLVLPDIPEHQIIHRVYENVKPRSHQLIMDTIAALPNPGPEISIDRIYYINMDHRLGRRSIMEKWLSKQNIPYERVRGQPGVPDQCVSHKNGGAQCVGISGLTFSNLNIMKSYNTTGYTLVLEDDMFLMGIERALMAVPLVPADWDVIRFDCFDPPLDYFPTIGGKGLDALAFRATIDRETCPKGKQNWFCGGTMAMLWKDSSIGKLREVWSQVPYNDIDCRLTDPSLKSYCLQVGLSEQRSPKNERSDIPQSG